MKAFTDIFVKRPVLAIVVNVIIIIAGIQAWQSLSVRQYPQSENASVTVATVLRPDGSLTSTGVAMYRRWNAASSASAAAYCS